MRVETLERFKEMLRITSTYTTNGKDSKSQVGSSSKIGNKQTKIVGIGRSKSTGNYDFLKPLVDICGIDFCRPAFSWKVIRILSHFCLSFKDFCPGLAFSVEPRDPKRFGRAAAARNNEAYGLKVAEHSFAGGQR